MTDASSSTTTQHSSQEKASSFHEKEQHIKSLREQLQQLHEQKEAQYRQKESSRDKILQYLSIIKQAQQQRNTLTGQVKVQKKLRDEFNEQIKQYVEQMKVLTPDEKKESTDKKISARRPGQLQLVIAKLEKSIETEGMGFEKEKKVMKEINALKKELAMSKDMQQHIFERRKLSDGLYVLRSKANVLHREIQEKAKQSQIQHQLVMANVKELEAARIAEQEVFIQFSRSKEQYQAVLEQLKALQGDVQVEKEQRFLQRKEKYKQQEEVEQRTLAEKKEEVLSKLKKGKGVTLTMKDLLVFQSGKDEE